VTPGHALDRGNGSGLNARCAIPFLSCQLVLSCTIPLRNVCVEMHPVDVMVRPIDTTVPVGSIGRPVAGGVTVASVYGVDDPISMPITPGRWRATPWRAVMRAAPRASRAVMRAAPRASRAAPGPAWGTPSGRLHPCSRDDRSRRTAACRRRRPTSMRPLGNGCVLPV
jgi:hypothetical protein